MKLLLVCDTNIIKDIFTLICKKLNIELIIQENMALTKQDYDFIVIDQSFIDDKFNTLKQHSKRLGAISSEELPFDKARDFLIPRPFLPTKLEFILKDEIEEIKKVILRKSDEELEDTEVTIPVGDYLETLVDDVYNKTEEENDESMVTFDSLNEGGVLDRDELSKINSILSNNKDVIKEIDLKEISDIIDDALNEIKEFEFDFLSDTKYEIILTEYKVEELKPLLSKLNQNIIDKLMKGEVIDITLKLKKD